VVDSISHEWNGSGGCLEIHERLGGRWQDWAIVTPRHQAFIDKILNSSSHIITTVRRKMDYSMESDMNGKSKVVKHGTKEITRDGFEYELTVNFELINEKHLVRASKDRTSLFANKPEFVITPAIGKRILDWCNVKPTSIKEMLDKIESSLSVSELTKLYNENPSYQETLKKQFTDKKMHLEGLTNQQNFNSNEHKHL
jgi:hypothetical protein